MDNPIGIKTHKWTLLFKSWSIPLNVKNLSPCMTDINIQIEVKHDKFNFQHYFFAIKSTIVYPSLRTSIIRSCFFFF